MTYELYTAAQNAVKGHSGRGRSYWEVAANCGYQRYLTDLRKHVEAGEEPDWARRGVYYHFLQEQWHRGSLHGAIELFPSDTCWKEAVTLFDWYRRTYTTTTFGTPVGIEEQFPVTDEDKQRVAEWFGIPPEYCPTARFDMRTNISESQVIELATNHGILLPGAGTYVIDFKHGGAHFGDDAVKFSVGPQAILYMTMAQKFIDSSCRGVIFNKVSMTREKGALTLKPTSFRTYTTAFRPEYAGRARSMIRYAYQSLISKSKNGFVCGDCPFYKETNVHGPCDGINGESNE